MSTEPHSILLAPIETVAQQLTSTADKKNPTQIKADEHFINFTAIINNFSSRTLMLNQALQLYNESNTTSSSIFSKIGSTLFPRKEEQPESKSFKHRPSEILQIQKISALTQKTLRQLTRLWEIIRSNFSAKKISLEEGIKLEELSLMIANKITLINRKAVEIENLKNYLEINEREEFGPSSYVEEDDTDSHINFPIDSVKTAMDSKDILDKIFSLTGVTSISDMRNVSRSWRETLQPQSPPEDKLEALEKEDAIINFIGRIPSHILVDCCYCDRELAEIVLQNPIKYNTNFINVFCIAACHNMLTKQLLEGFSHLPVKQRQFIFKHLFYQDLEQAKTHVTEYILDQLGSINLSDESQKLRSLILLLKNDLLDFDLTRAEFLKIQGAIRQFLDKDQSLARDFLTEDRLTNDCTPNDLNSIAIAFPELALTIATRTELATRIPAHSSSTVSGWDKIITSNPAIARLAFTHEYLGLNTLNREGLLKLLNLETGLPWAYFNRCVKNEGWLTPLLLDDWINIAQQYPQLARGIIIKLGDQFSPAQLCKIAQQTQPHRPDIVQFILERLGTRLTDQDRAKLISLISTDQQAAYVKKYNQIENLVREWDKDDLVGIIKTDFTKTTAILFTPVAQNFNFKQLLGIAISVINDIPDIVKVILESRVKLLAPHEQHQLLMLLTPEQREQTYCYLKAINKITQNSEFNSLDRGLFPKITKDSKSTAANLPTRLASIAKSSSSSSASSSSSSSFFNSSSSFSSTSSTSFSSYNLSSERLKDVKPRGDITDFLSLEEQEEHQAAAALLERI